MKGIIVVDMPERCKDCDFIREGFNGACCERKSGEEGLCKEIPIEITRHGRPYWCPIKPLPEKLPEHEPVAYKDNDDNWINRMKRLPEHCGWNACLDVLLEE